MEQDAKMTPLMQRVKLQTEVLLPLLRHLRKPNCQDIKSPMIIIADKGISTPQLLNGDGVHGQS